MHVPGREATDRPAYQMGELLIQGESYPSAKGPGPDDPTLYEVNWADIRRPQESRFGVARHILDVILSLLDIASRWHFGAREGDRTKLLGAYGFLVECALLWSLGYTLLARWLYLAKPDPVLTLGIGVLAAAVIVVLGWLLRDSSRALQRAGLVWALLTLATTAAIAWAPLTLEKYVSLETFVLFSTFLYSWIAFAIGLTLFLGMVWAGIRYWRHPWQLATRCAAACLPIAVLAVAGACVWAIDPALIGETTDQASRAIAETAANKAYWHTAKNSDKEDKYTHLLSKLQATEARKAELNEVQRKALRYGLWHPTSALISTTLALAALGFLVFSAALVCAMVQMRDGKSGLVANHSIRWLVGIGLPLLTIVAMGFSLYDGIFNLHLTVPPDQPLKTVWDKWDLRDLFWESGFYQRLGVVLLALLVPAGAVASDIFGDITFWSASGTKEFRKVVGERFMKLVNRLLQDVDAIVIIVAHSQGTVIAVEGLQGLSKRDLSRIRLVTMGSPLHSLYKPLFGLYGDASCGPLASLKEWRNFFRSGDPIGGEIKCRKCTNAAPWAGGHTHYWTDPRMPWSELLRCGE